MREEYDPLLLRMFLNYPYLPTPRTVIETALTLLDLDETAIFADLGSGEGNVTTIVAEKFNCFCVGFEIDLRLIKEAKQKIKNTPIKHNIEYVQADLFRVDLSHFDAIYVYPFPTIAPKLSEKIKTECKKTTKIVAYDYPLVGFTPKKVATVNVGLHTNKIYLYTL
ncbi:MAG: methyltransferase domain-containing protein [Candidatus Bathyarchaeota archaeon]|nr:methyltransferase domain-containing protein [Candidatus Bathyarchaeota archaeon]